jgi:hypothetical protein
VDVYSKRVKTDSVIKKCFIRIKEHGVFVDYQSFFSCAAYVLTQLNKKEVRFVIMNASGNVDIARPHDTQALQLELDSNETNLFDVKDECKCMQDFLTYESDQRFQYQVQIFGNCRGNKIKNYNCDNTYHIFLNECGNALDMFAVRQIKSGSQIEV